MRQPNKLACHVNHKQACSFGLKFSTILILLQEKKYFQLFYAEEPCTTSAYRSSLHFINFLLGMHHKQIWLHHNINFSNVLKAYLGVQNFKLWCNFHGKIQNSLIGIVEPSVRNFIITEGDGHQYSLKPFGGGMNKMYENDQDFDLQDRLCSHVLHLPNSVVNLDPPSFKQYWTTKSCNICYSLLIVSGSV